MSAGPAQSSAGQDCSHNLAYVVVVVVISSTHRQQQTTEWLPWWQALPSIEYSADTKQFRLEFRYFEANTLCKKEVV